MSQIIEFAFRHWPYIIALGIVALLIMINEALGRKNNALNITPKDLVNLINHESAIILDIRSSEDFRHAHIIDAVLTKADQLDKKQLERYKTHPVVIVCQRGIQSFTCAQKAKQQGFDKVYSLAGGLQAWINAELPVIKGK